MFGVQVTDQCVIPTDCSDPDLLMRELVNLIKERDRLVEVGWVAGMKYAHNFLYVPLCLSAIVSLMLSFMMQINVRGITA